MSNVFPHSTLKMPQGKQQFDIQGGPCSDLQLRAACAPCSCRLCNSVRHLATGIPCHLRAVLGSRHFMQSCAVARANHLVQLCAAPGPIFCKAELCNSQRLPFCAAPCISWLHAFRAVLPGAWHLVQPHAGQGVHCLPSLPCCAPTCLCSASSFLLLGQMLVTHNPITVCSQTLAFCPPSFNSP